MHKHHSDYTGTFRALSLERLPDEPLFLDSEFSDWHTQWQLRLNTESKPKDLSRQLMRSHNPATIPRNHRVEEALEAAVVHSDFTVVQRLLTALKSPFDDSPEQKDYSTPPPFPSSGVYQTFCGT